MKNMRKNINDEISNVEDIEIKKYHISDLDMRILVHTLFLEWTVCKDIIELPIGIIDLDEYLIQYECNKNPYFSFTSNNSKNELKVHIKSITFIGAMTNKDLRLKSNFYTISDRKYTFD